ncbi:MAG: type II 3-dehydroquinate dehydratase [Oscillospiraceae bacterium]|nr:type II 3-dehydroquinate dehydratase [Oscillospiraceae bacterium]
MKILVINGPNLNMLGIREPELYGDKDYDDLLELIKEIAEQEKVDVECVQSNHEGVIVEIIQAAYGKYDGIIINPAAYTHTSIAILDALKAVGGAKGIPAVEVHLTNPNEREGFRKISYTEKGCVKTFAGYGLNGYEMAIRYLVTLLKVGA